MNDDEKLQHNYLERKTQDAAPADLELARARTWNALSGVFFSPDAQAKIEQEFAEAERFAFDSCICMGGKPIEHSLQRSGCLHKRECPQFEPTYKRGDVMVALTVCDIGTDMAVTVLRVLDHLASVDE